MVVDFTVENGDDGAVFVEYWLMASFRGDYGEAAMAERDILVDEKTVIIGAAMPKAVIHCMDDSLGFTNAMMVGDASYAAHDFELKAFLVLALCLVHSRHGAAGWFVHVLEGFVPFQRFGC